MSLQAHSRGCRRPTGGVGMAPGGGLEVFCQFDDGATTRLRRLGGGGQTGLADQQHQHSSGRLQVMAVQTKEGSAPMEEKE